VKKNSIILFFLIIFSLSTGLNAQKQNVYDMKLKFITAINLRYWTVVDDFDFQKSNNWEFNYKQGAGDPEDTSGKKVFLRKVEPGAKFSEVEGGRFLSEKYNISTSCLGAKIVFPEHYQTTFLVRPKESMLVNGLCRKISLWVLGRGKNIDLEIAVSDYLGKGYFLYAGKLDFIGWKYLEVEIPASIPQNFGSFPQQELIKFEGFLVTNNPSRFADEIYKPYYFYVDHLEALMDQNVEKFPGVEITDNW